jgi:hypothetical protein
VLKQLDCMHVPLHICTFVLGAANIVITVCTHTSNSAYDSTLKTLDIDRHTGNVLHVQ